MVLRYAVLCGVHSVLKQSKSHWCILGPVELDGQIYRQIVPPHAAAAIAIQDKTCLVQCWRNDYQLREGEWMGNNCPRQKNKKEEVGERVSGLWGD